MDARVSGMIQDDLQWRASMDARMSGVQHTLHHLNSFYQTHYATEYGTGYDPYYDWNAYEEARRQQQQQDGASGSGAGHSDHP